MKQQVRRHPGRRGPRILRRASTVRGGSAPSMRSIRSGYAFSHQQGFGDLITTGSMMSVRPRPRSARIKGPPPRYGRRPADNDEVDGTTNQRRRDHKVRYIQESIFVCFLFVHNIANGIQEKKHSKLESSPP